jgi:hypothetical protein
MKTLAVVMEVEGRTYLKIIKREFTRLRQIEYGSEKKRIV